MDDTTFDRASFGFKYTGCNLCKEDQQYGAWLRAIMARFYKSPPTPQQEDLQCNSDRPTPPNPSRLNITPIPDVSDHREMNMPGSVGMDGQGSHYKLYSFLMLTPGIDRELNKFPNPLDLC